MLPYLCLCRSTLPHLFLQIKKVLRTHSHLSQSVRKHRMAHVPCAIPFLLMLFVLMSEIPLYRSCFHGTGSAGWRLLSFVSLYYSCFVTVQYLHSCLASYSSFPSLRRLRATSASITAAANSIRLKYRASGVSSPVCTASDSVSDSVSTSSSSDSSSDVSSIS